MTIIGYILLVAGCLTCLVGELMFLNTAYRRSFIWFFGCLFVPLVAEAFLLTHWRASWKPYALAVGGLIVAGLGLVVAG